MSVVFDQLRISDDGKNMLIDIHVNKADYFENVYLKSITIATADKVPESASLSSLTESDYIYKRTFGSGLKEASLMLSATDFNENYGGSDMGKNLFFVWVECEGNYSECTPCFADEPTLGVTFDGKLLYQQAMGYTKELADDCNISDGFIDFILNYSAFKAAVETDHFCDARKFYNQMFNLKSSPTRIAGRGCGCHG